jgi:hypothetical protein
MTQEGVSHAANLTLGAYGRIERPVAAWPIRLNLGVAASVPSDNTP